MKNKPKIEILKTDSLIPYARNSRTHSKDQVAQIACSIQEFGFTNPVLIDGENGIIAGHGRIMAAQKLGLAEVPCIRLDHLTETQRKAYVIADNKLALNSKWDEAMLGLELAELRELDFDLNMIGFDGDYDNTPSFEVESDIKRSQGKGPYHIKDICIGAFALKSSSNVTNHKQLLKMKKSDPQSFALLIASDYIELLDRPGPTRAPIKYVTTPGTTNNDHPMFTVAEIVAKNIGAEFVKIFDIGEKRKSKGLHAEKSLQILSRTIDKGSGIMIIDDVVTTGRTLRKCVDEIHKSGNFAFPFAWLCYQ